MTTAQTEFPKIAKAGAVFFLCWLAGFGVSLLVMYSRFRWPDSHLIVFFLNQMFFYVQTALPRSFVTTGDNNHEVLSGPAAIMAGVIFWMAIGFAFAWLTRRLRLYFTVPLAVVSIFVVLIGMQALLYFFNIQVELAAP